MDVVVSKKYRPHEFAKLVGVSTRTLWSWEEKGLLIADRTPTNMRYYTDEHYRQFIGYTKRSVEEYNSET